jgi:predicted nucleotidyltransferase
MEKKLMERLKAAVGGALKDEPVVAAYLFGSHASGLATAFSDIDIALVTSELSLEKEIALEQKVQDRIYHDCGLENVDVRILNKQSLVFQGQALEHSILLYSRDEEARIAYETRTRDLYFDFLPVVEQHRKVFFDRLRKEGLLYGKPSDS